MRLQDREGEKEEGFILPSEVLAKTSWDSHAAFSALSLRPTESLPRVQLAVVPTSLLGDRTELSLHTATLERWRGTTPST